MISINHQAKLRLKNAAPYKWELNSATFCLLSVIAFLGPILVMGSVP